MSVWAINALPLLGAVLERLVVIQRVLTVAMRLHTAVHKRDLERVVHCLELVRLVTKVLAPKAITAPVHHVLLRRLGVSHVPQAQSVLLRTICSASAAAVVL